MTLSRPSDSALYQLFDLSPIGMYRVTEDGRLRYVNAALVRLLGYDSAEQLKAVNFARDVYVDAEARRRLIEKYRPLGRADGVRADWKRRDGGRLIVRIYGHVVEDGSFDGSVLDVTELEAANAELRRQREELQRTATTLDMVVRQVSAVYWLVDRELRILRTGGAVSEVVGYTPGINLGRTLADVIADDPAVARTAIDVHQRALAGEVVTTANEYRGKLLETTIAPYRVDGEIAGAIGTTIDVTAVRTLERRMVEAQRAESLGVLAAGLAHDFNNLLVAILGNAELGLRQTAPGASGHAALAQIRSAALRGSEFTHQLLTFAGRGTGTSATFAPRPIIEELLAIFAPRIPASVRVLVEVPGELTLRGDAGQLRQVMMNLIVNARDSIGDRAGMITIAARHVLHDGTATPDDVLAAAPGSYIALSVTDDGVGIDPEHRRRIFEPFFTTKPTGHGLGLAAVLGIIRAHGGGLRLGSAVGTGTTVRVLWPTSAAASPEPGAPAPPRRTVLVIDDEELVRDVVARMIEDLGYGAVTAADGATGLAIAEREPIAAVLVDLTMPRMSGAEVIAGLRQRRPELPVVLCSGFDRDGKGPVQADAYLPKPFRIETLEQILAKLVR